MIGVSVQFFGFRFVSVRLTRYLLSLLRYLRKANTFAPAHSTANMVPKKKISLNLMAKNVKYVNPASVNQLTVTSGFLIVYCVTYILSGMESDASSFCKLDNNGRVLLQVL